MPCSRAGNDWTARATGRGEDAGTPVFSPSAFSASAFPEASEAGGSRACGKRQRPRFLLPVLANSQTHRANTVQGPTCQQLPRPAAPLDNFQSTKPGLASAHGGAAAAAAPAARPGSGARAARPPAGGAAPRRCPSSPRARPGARPPLPLPTPPPPANTPHLCLLHLDLTCLPT